MIERIEYLPKFQEQILMISVNCQQGTKERARACIEPPAILLGLKPAADIGIISR
jgi:hypothetical protein